MPPTSVERAAGFIARRSVKQVPARVYDVGGHVVVLFIGAEGEHVRPATCDCTAGQHDQVCAHQLAAAHEFKEGR